MPSVDTLYERLDGKIKVWMGFPSSWQPGLRRTVALALHWAGHKWELPEAIRRGEKVLESGNLMMTSSSMRQMEDGVEIPQWEGEFPADMMLDVIKEQFNACSDSKDRGATGLPRRRARQIIEASGETASEREEHGDRRLVAPGVQGASRAVRDRPAVDGDSCRRNEQRDQRHHKRPDDLAGDDGDRK